MYRIKTSTIRKVVALVAIATAALTGNLLTENPSVIRALESLGWASVSAVVTAVFFALITE
jgi:Na+/proline symporter